MKLLTGKRIEDAMAIASQKLSGRRIADVARHCAVFDLGYYATFMEGSNGLFKYTGSICSLPTGGRAGLGVMQSIELSSSMIDHTGPTQVCAWCQAAARQIVDETYTSSVKCNKCQRFVCLGRVEGLDFRCSDSCGARGRLTPNFTDTSARLRRAQDPERKAIAGPERLMLGGGTGLIKTS